MPHYSIGKATKQGNNTDVNKSNSPKNVASCRSRHPRHAHTAWLQPSQGAKMRPRQKQIATPSGTGRRAPQYCGQYGLHRRGQIAMIAIIIIGVILIALMAQQMWGK